MIDRHLCRWISAVGLALAAGLATPIASAQPVRPPILPPPARPAEPAVQPEAVQQRLAALQQLDAEDPAVKTESALLNEAMKALQDAAAEVARTAEFEELARTAPDRLKQIQAELATPIEQAVPAVPDGLTLDELSGQLQSALAQFEAARKVRADLETEFNDRSARQATIPGQIAEATQALNRLRESLNAAADPNDPPAIAQSRRWSALASKRLMEARLSRLDQESRSYTVRSDLLRARRDRAQRDVVIAERIAQQLQAKVDAKRAEQAARAREEAELARLRAANAHPVVQEITETTEAMAQDNERITARIKAVNDDHQRIIALVQKWNREFDTIRQQEEKIGLDEVLGLRLRTQRVQLPSLRTLRGESRVTREELRQAQATWFRYDDDDVVDVSESVDERLAASTAPIPEGEGDTVRAAAIEALAAQTAVRGTVLSTYDDYLRALTEQHNDLQQLASLVDEYGGFIDQRVLWIQSAEPLKVRDLMNTVDATRYLLDPSNWMAVGGAWWTDMRRAWPLHGLFIIVFGALLAARRRLHAVLVESGKAAGRIINDRYRHTLLALAVTTVRALTWPLLVWFAAWRLAINAGLNDFVASTAASLGRVAIVFFALDFMRRLCQPQGLAEAHFRWRESNLKLLRRHLRWFVPFIVPLAFVVLLLTNVADENHRDSLGRLAFMAGMPAVALFVQQLFHPDRGILSNLIAQHRGGWVDRLRFVWYPAFVIAPLGFAVAAGMGYVYTALQLERLLNNTVVLILGVMVGHEMLLRWLNVVQRQLAIEQARKKRAALLKARAEAEQAGDKSGDAAGGEAPLPPPEIKDVDVAAVSAQTRSLLRTAIAFTAILGIIAVWADVLPAFGILREVELFNSTQFIDGAATAVSITLENLVLAVLILFITFVVSKNIPGLLEIVILQRLPFTPGGRYAITTIVRYVMVIVGVVVAFDQFGIGWSQVQWLAAAITVGLGFGLQEIFANFVSGLIILFERPIRVGDTITVGTLNGTVSRIHMRATTIIDWDRKEIIIPNKEFVTGQIVNWSLSDAVLRVRIPVGIAYGSDTAAARRLMLECARQNARVLGDPAPQALFLGFGESSLDFELRVFIPNIDHFVPARDELHEAIDQAFRRHHIEIAFPQRDLHVRSISPALEIVDRSRAFAPDIESVESGR